MTIFNQIVPGKVNNRGIKDNSIPDYAVAYPVYPLHAPVISIVTPKGELAAEKGTQWISTKDFVQMFGDVLDHKTPYYNPTSLLIQQLGRGAQSVIGVRRLSANNVVSRIAISAFVQQVEVQDYERDLSGQFKRDPATGLKIPVVGKTYQGLKVVLRPDPAAATKAFGKLEHRTIPGTPADGETPAVPATEVYPMFELPAGVGDAYNNGGVNLGVSNTPLSWKSISAFVRSTGVFPFDMRMFSDSANGARTYAKTDAKKETAQFTLFPAEADGVQYSLKRAVGAFTKTNANRKVVPTPAPFKDAFVYAEEIDTVCQLMYIVEKDVNDSLVEVGQRPYQQMNPFTATNHVGAPYFAIQTDDATLWDLSGAVKAQYGVNPFYLADGSIPDYVTEVVPNDPFGLLAGVKFPLTNGQAWEITNKLMADDLQTYVNGSEIKNYTRNRQSVFWDVGYTKEVKDIAAQLLGQRKDVFVFEDATVWTPGQANDLSTIYSRAAALVASLRLTPESEQWGTPTVRASINLIEAKLINEVTGDFFSGNLDLAYAFALFAGNNSGIIVASNSPDHGDNRILRTMHSPNIEFEEDEVGNDNFENGSITLRPYDVEQLFRPALVTVYNNADSVLKDAVTAFLCVCAEKIMQDEWNTVCGDTSISAANYAALVKDGGERKLRDRLGGLVKNITVVTSYDETAPGGRAVMNAVVNAYFNKGKYMMNLDLYAYNEQDAVAS